MISRTLTALVLFASLTSHGENWPQFRGPTLQGISPEKNLPIHWSATEHVLWKTSIPGAGWSSPIVWDNQIFVTSATDEGAAFHVMAVNARTGKILWDKEVGRQMPGHKQRRNSYATPTPCTDGRTVFTCFGDGSFFALDFDGNIRWQNRDYSFYGEHGLGTSPILWKDLLIMTRDGSGRPPDTGAGWHTAWDQARILALEISSGKTGWQANRGPSRIAHVVPNIWVAPGGHAELISGAGDVVQGFDLTTGERLWTSRNIGEGVVPSIVLGDNIAFTGSGWGGRESTKAFRLGGHGDLGESNLVWEQKKGSSKIPSYLYLKPYLYVLNESGVVTCLKEENGEVVWQERIGGTFSASPVAAENHIYFLSDEGETTVIETGPIFKVIARNVLGEKCQASIAISHGSVFIRSVTSLFCIH